jgi:oligopeptide/dipeptide ABC transporter ATP-binding protein
MAQAKEIPARILEDDFVLSVDGLRTYIDTPTGVVRAVDGVDMEVRRGKILGIIGESGSGKSVMAKSLLGLVHDFPGVVEGRVLYREGGCVRNLTAAVSDTVRIDRNSDGNILSIAKDAKAWRREVNSTYQDLWGRKMSMIFQDPQTSLNPFWSVGEQLGEAVQKGESEKLTKTQKTEISVSWLKKVRIREPEKVLNAYAHNLSGGMCQRVMIAIALASQPTLVIADEPTTGIDATVQARIVDLLKNLQEETGMTIIVISHDIGMVSRLADDIIVMYCGQVLEYGRRDDVLSLDPDSHHPYTNALLSSLPTVSRVQKGEPLRWIEQEVPSAKAPPQGCRFHPRCDVYQGWENGSGSSSHHLAMCPQTSPVFSEIGPHRGVRCFEVDAMHLERGT